VGSDGKPSGKYVDQIDKMTQYSKQLDDTRKTLAEYWEDGPGTVTPPGHWNQFAQWVARRVTNTLHEDASPVLRPQQRPDWMPASASGMARAAGTRSGLSASPTAPDHNTIGHGRPGRWRGARLPESAMQHKVQPRAAIGVSSLAIGSQATRRTPIHCAV
jgi:hypothetical protein